jgi:methionyl-tRNA formyltransferase
MERHERIVYLGTEGNAKSCLGLQDVIENGWTVCLVVGYDAAVPLAPVGRPGPIAKRIVRRVVEALDGMMSPPPPSAAPLAFRTLASTCAANDIPFVLTTGKALREETARIAETNPAVILSNGWMFKIRPRVFELAATAALNCHSSHLPEYRGGNVTFAPLINGEVQSGVTVHELVEKFDAGRILAQTRVDIMRGDTPESLDAKRACVTGPVLIEALEVAGHEDRYRPNPPSPFYRRCSYATYRRLKLVNAIRERLRLKPIRYEPVVQDDL